MKNTLKDSATLDQITARTNSDKIRDRLLLEDDSLTLDKAVEIAARIESAVDDSRRLVNTPVFLVNEPESVNFVERDGHR